MKETIKTQGVSKMRAMGYVRVSTDEQAREGVSLDHQESKVEAYAALNDLDLVEVIRDGGQSGKDLDRPGIQRLLEIVENNEIDAVIVYKLDRLSRNTVDTLNMIQLLEKKEIAFHSIQEKVDTKSATGKFFLTITSAIAQMERDMIAERTREALAHKKTKNEWTGRIPYGFRIVDGHLVEDKKELAVITKAKRMRRTGKSYRAIAETLNLSVGFIHKIVNVNMKTLKAVYCAA